MGGCVMGSLDKIQPIATVNLSIQHLRQPVLDEVLICSAQVEGLENQIAVVTGKVTSFEDNLVLASAVGSFMIGTRAKPLPANNGRK
ncbi:MAG: PaaI family thioesterase [Rhizobiaceae bacterium]|nr:PaaI family thioesterase [Rhizobiaceae bacterium]